MNTEWNDATKRLVAVGLVIFGLFVIYISRSVLALILVAALIAFLLMPFVAFLHRRLKLPRPAAVLLAHVLLIVVIVLSPLILLPPVISGFGELAEVEYQTLFDDGLQWVTESLRSLSQFDMRILGVPLDFSPVTDPALRLLEEQDSSFLQLPSFETIMNSVQAALTVTVGVAANLAGSVFSAVLAVVLTFFFSVYISLDAHKMRDLAINLVPPAYRSEISVLINRLTKIWRAYFRGQLQLMFIIGIVTWIIGLMIGLPNAFTLAVVAGVMELIPNLGPILAAIPAILLALIQGSNFLPVSNLIFALIVIGAYALIQQIENNLIVPRILGEAVELPALVVMAGVIVGASVGGILGALLAAPTIASIKEIISYLYAKLLNEEPFPPQPDTPEPTVPSWLDQLKGLLARLGAARAKPAPSESEQAQSETSQEQSSSKI